MKEDEFTAVGGGYPTPADPFVIEIKRVDAGCDNGKPPEPGLGYRKMDKNAGE
jgi:hypothetical protein